MPRGKKRRRAKEEEGMVWGRAARRRAMVRGFGGGRLSEVDSHFWFLERSRRRKKRGEKETRSPGKARPGRRIQRRPKGPETRDQRGQEPGGAG